MFDGYIKERHNLTISQGIISLLSRHEETTTRERIFYQTKMKTMLVVVLATVFLAFVSATPECPPNQDDVVLISNPDDCASYYACDSGVAYLMNCSAGLLFNPELQVCDWADNVTCSLYPTTKPPSTGDLNEVTVGEPSEEPVEEPDEVPVKEPSEESDEDVIKVPNAKPCETSSESSESSEESDELSIYK